MQAARGAAWPVLRASPGRLCHRPHERRPLERCSCVDPIEKKPLNHFLPGTPVLSFGTAGCNLACRFCQNWDLSKSWEVDTLADAASPGRVAATALALGCRSVAFTYKRPGHLRGVRDRCRRRLQEGRRSRAGSRHGPRAWMPQRRFHLQRPGHLRGVTIDVADACRKAGVRTVAVTA